MNMKVKVGDKFSTKNGIIKPVLGEDAKTGNSREYQLKEVQCYVAYEKTGKINPKTHKVSNEIVITEIFNEPRTKVERGRPNVYSEYFVEWMRSLCSSDGLYSKNELLKYGGIIHETEQVNIYKTLDEIQDMTKQELKEYKAKKQYLFSLQNEFKSKVEKALKKLQIEVPSLEWKPSYRVTYEEERKEWVEADAEEVELIKFEIEQCQNEICKKYNCDSFNKIKWDNEKYFEFSELLDENLIEKYGIYGKVWVISIVGNSELIDEDEAKDYICEYIPFEILPTIKALMKKRMEKIIDTTGYDPNKYKNNNDGFGERNSNIQQDKIFTLKYSKSVLSFHASIFGRINEEDFESMYKDDVIGLLCANRKGLKEEYFGSNDEEIIINDDEEYDDDNPFGMMEEVKEPQLSERQKVVNDFKFDDTVIIKKRSK